VFAEFLRKYMLLIGIGALLLLADIIVFAFLALPKINAEAIGLERLTGAMERQTVLRTRLAALADDKRALEDAKGDLQSFYLEHLGDRMRQIEVIKERNSIAADYGVQPTRVSYSITEVKNQPLERFMMTFPLQGNYASLRFFINTIERSSNFLLIDDVQLESGEQKSELSMRIAVSTYFYRPEGSGAVLETSGEVEEGTGQ
jgi:Tfp pilus assembly protein PilO